MVLITLVEVFALVSLVLLNGHKESLLTSVSTINSGTTDGVLANNTKEKEKDLVVDTKLLKVVTNVKVREVVYDGMTLEELGAKLERSMNSTLDGKGYMFAKKCIDSGVDPYLALAIVLEETGCKWECSALVKSCYNIGGQKGAPGCFGGEYRRYESLDHGINWFIENLANSYFDRGLNTAAKMNPYYAGNPNWHVAVNRYINEIKAS